MDAGTVLVDGAVVLTAGNDASPIPAAVTANAEGTIFTLDPTADLAFDTEYTVTVAGTVDRRRGQRDRRAGQLLVPHRQGGPASAARRRPPPPTRAPRSA